MVITDGTGRGGYDAKVNKNNALVVISESESIQHTQSIRDKNAFQVIGYADLASGTVVPLFCTNTSLTHNMVITYARYQILDAAGGTSLPNASNYFDLSLGGSYSSGGTAVTPVNLFVGSGIESYVTCYQGTPTLTGTITEIDRWYTKANGDMNVFNKEGSIIIPTNNSICLRFTGDHTSGIIYSRISFIMKEAV